MTRVISGGSVADSLAKARLFLDDARANLEQNRLETAADRGYYAMFHAARAMLIHQQVPVPRTHSGLRSVVAERLVKTGLAPRSLSRGLARGAELREEMTYTLYASHGPDVVQQVLDDAEAVLLLADAMCKGPRARGGT